MPNTTNTPNMNLVLPVPGQDPGPDWAQNQYASGFIIDGHNHTSGQGVPIPTAGININTDLPFNGQSAFNLNSVRFNNLGSPLPAIAPNLGCIYEANGEFYYNDAAGNQVQITKSGTVNATSSGIVSGTASAGFVGGVLVVDQNTNTPGNIQAGSYFFGNNTPASNFAELSAPSSLAASYSIVLPPSNSTGSTAFLTIDTSNNMGEGPALSGGITGANIASQTITEDLLALRPTGGSVPIGGVAISNTSDGTFVSSSSYVDVNDSGLVTLAATIITTGRPVMVSFQGEPGDSSAHVSVISTVDTTPFTATGYVAFLRNGTIISSQLLECYTQNAGGSPGGTNQLHIPASSFRYLDIVSAGTYTYSAQIKVFGGSGTPEIAVNNSQIVAYEI